MNALDFTRIAPPSIIEPLSFELIFAAMLADLQARDATFSALVESDPAYKILEVAAYRELLLRLRINESARSNLLAFAIGGDLDQLAANYGVVRMTMVAADPLATPPVIEVLESDDRLRTRLQLRIAALAANGTAEHYRFVALSAHADVIDAAALQTLPGSVLVVIWLPDGSTALPVIAARFLADDVRPLGVAVAVAQAMPIIIDVQATLYTEPTAPTNLVSTLSATLPVAIADYARLGRDMPLSWLISRLHVDGVSRVALQAPTTNKVLEPNEYAVAGQINLINGGSAW